MATLTIRNPDPQVKQALRDRAARHGVSMAEEARRVLQGSVDNPPLSFPAKNDEPDSLFSRMRRRVEKNGGGFNLEVPPRTDIAGECTKFWWLEEPETPDISE